MLADKASNYKTVHDAFKLGAANEIESGFDDVANELRENGRWMKKNDSSMRRTLWPKGGVSEIGPTKRGKGN